MNERVNASDEFAATCAGMVDLAPLDGDVGEAPIPEESEVV
jgi:hypothetical protein